MLDDRLDPLARERRAQPFRYDRLVPRITVEGSLDGPGLEQGFRTQPEWTVEEKRTLIDRGRRLTDEQLREIEPPLAAEAY